MKIKSKRKTKNCAHQKNDKKIKNPNVNIKNSLCRFLLKKRKKHQRKHRNNNNKNTVYEYA
jgi:hypothetical protein